MESRRPLSRSRSGSHTSNKSVSRSPRRRRVLHSISRSPPQLLQRSRSPAGRGRSPTFIRSKSPVRRARSPMSTRSPRRRRHSPRSTRSPRRHRHSPAFSRSPMRHRRSPAFFCSSRGRSPIPAARSPRRRRSLSYSPRGRSPVLHSPRRRRSPVYSRSSPRRRKSPPRTPTTYRRRSPVYGCSPPRRYPPPSPPLRKRHTASLDKKHIDSSRSPRQHPLSQSGRRVSSSPLHSSSPEAFTRSPHRQVSPRRQVCPSPHLRSLLPSIPEKLNRGSPSPPVQQRPPTSKHLPSSGKVEKTVDNHRLRTQRHAALERCRTLSPSLSPERRHSSRVSLELPPGNGKSMPTVNKKRSRSSSTESSLPDEVRQAVHLKKATVFDDSAVGLPTVNYQARQQEEPDQSVSQSDVDWHTSPGVDRKSRKSVESDDNEEDYGSPMPANLDDRKASKKRRKVERKLRKEEKRRRRQERQRKREEKRGSKGLSKGVASVTPPPDLDERMMHADNYKVEGGRDDDEMTIEQRRLENELREKALDSIKAKKVWSS